MECNLDKLPVCCLLNIVEYLTGDGQPNDTSQQGIGDSCLSIDWNRDNEDSEWLLDTIPDNDSNMVYFFDLALVENDRRFIDCGSCNPPPTDLCFAWETAGIAFFIAYMKGYLSLRRCPSFLGLQGQARTEGIAMERHLDRIDDIIFGRWEEVVTKMTY